MSKSRTKDVRELVEKIRERSPHLEKSVVRNLVRFKLLDKRMSPSEERKLSRALKRAFKNDLNPSEKEMYQWEAIKQEYLNNYIDRAWEKLLLLDSWPEIKKELQSEEPLRLLTQLIEESNKNLAGAHTSPQKWFDPKREKEIKELKETILLLVLYGSKKRPKKP